MRSVRLAYRGGSVRFSWYFKYRCFLHYFVTLRQRLTLTDKLTVSCASLRTRSAYRRLLSFAPTPLTGSAHAPPIKGVGADCASRHGIEKSCLFNSAPAMLAAQQPALTRPVITAIDLSFGASCDKDRISQFINPSQNLRYYLQVLMHVNFVISQHRGN